MMLHKHDVNLRFYHIPNMLCWLKIWKVCQRNQSAQLVLKVSKCVKFGKDVQTVASLSCPYLSQPAPGVVICSSNPSASIFNLLSI